jgi:internalin A
VSGGNGVILYEDQTKAKVVESYTNYGGEITVHITGQRKRDLLVKVDYVFDEIHANFNNLKYDKLVPCNCPTCQTKLEPGFYKFNELRERIINSKLTIECKHPPYHSIDIWNLIDDVNLKHLLQPDNTEKAPVINIQVHTGSGDNAAGNKNTVNN